MSGCIQRNHRENEEVGVDHVNEVDQDAPNALFTATLRGASKNELEKLMEDGTVLTIRNTEGESVLHVAARVGNLEAVTCFVSKGLEVDAKNLEGTTPLINAGLAKEKFLQIVDIFVENGADIHAVNNYKNNVIFAAVWAGRPVEDLKILMRRGVNWRHLNKAGQSILHTAASVGNLEALRFFISEGADIRARDLNQVTPLINTYCAKQNFLGVVDLLLEHGADLNAVNEIGQNLIFLATCERRPIEDLEGLINRGADWKERPKWEMTPLHVTAINDDLEALRFYISKGADVNARNCIGATPLMHAVAFSKKSYMEIVEFLITNGADINAVDENGDSVVSWAISHGKSREELEFLVGKRLDGYKLMNDLNNYGGSLAHAAVCGGNLEALRYLHTKGVNLDRKADKGWTPLMFTAITEEMSLDVVDFLVENGADINAVNDLGESVLATAVNKNRNVRELEHLVNKGASLSTKDKWENSILHLAVKRGDPDVVKYFISKWTNVDVRNNILMTPLLQAAEDLKGNTAVEIINLLLEAGADINALDEDGGNLLCHLLYNGSEVDFLSKLVDRGANWDAKDNQGNSVLHDAVQVGNLEAIAYFVSKGVDVNVKNVHGQTPLIAARHSNGNFMEVVDTLLGNGADITAVDYSGNSLVLLATATDKSLAEIQQLVERGASMEGRNRKGFSIIHEAAERGNLDILRYLISNGSDVNDRVHNKSTPLMIAVRQGIRNMEESAKIQIEAGAEVNAVDVYWNHVVHLALEARREPTEVKKLIEMGCSWWTPNLSGGTLFQKLTKSRDYELFSYFMVRRTEEVDHFIF